MGLTKANVQGIAPATPDLVGKPTADHKASAKNLAGALGVPAGGVAPLTNSPTMHGDAAAAFVGAAPPTGGQTN